MNIHQKLGLVVVTLVAFNHQISPAKAGSIGTPYTPTLNANEGQTSNTNQVPTIADVLNNCNPNGTQAGIGGTSNGNTAGNANNGTDSSEPVPEPTTIAGATLAMTFGAWWKKKTASKAGKNSTEVG